MPSILAQHHSGQHEVSHAIANTISAPSFAASIVLILLPQLHCLCPRIFKSDELFVPAPQEYTRLQTNICMHNRTDACEPTHARTHTRTHTHTHTLHMPAGQVVPAHVAQTCEHFVAHGTLQSWRGLSGRILAH